MRVVVAVDALLWREGLIRLLEDADFDVVARAVDSTDFVRKAGAHRPDVAIIDVRAGLGPRASGLDAACDVRRRWPTMGLLALADQVDLGPVRQLFSFGTEGLGYMLTQRVSDLPRFCQAVRRVGQGGSALDPKVVSRLLAGGHETDPLDCLSAREAEVLGFVSAGHSNASIAAELYLSERGVEKHISNIYSKLEISSEPAHHRRVLAARAYLRSHHFASSVAA